MPQQLLASKYWLWFASAAGASSAETAPAPTAASSAAAASLCGWDDATRCVARLVALQCMDARSIATRLYGIVISGIGISGGGVHRGSLSPLSESKNAQLKTALALYEASRALD